VITLVKDGNEDDFLRETWNSIVFLRNSYISHASKSRRKRDSKAKKKKNAITGTKNISQEISAAPAPQITSENFSPLTTEGVGSIPVPVQVAPLNTAGVSPTDIVLVGKSQVPTQDKVSSAVGVSSTTTTTSAKSWAQIASPAKPEPSQAVREKDQEHPSSSRESSKADEDRQKKSKEKKR